MPLQIRRIMENGENTFKVIRIDDGKDSAPVGIATKIVERVLWWGWRLGKEERIRVLKWRRKFNKI